MLTARQGSGRAHASRTRHSNPLNRLLWRTRTHFLLADGTELLDDALRADIAAGSRAAAATDNRAAVTQRQLKVSCLSLLVLTVWVKLV